MTLLVTRPATDTVSLSGHEDTLRPRSFSATFLPGTLLKIKNPR